MSNIKRIQEKIELQLQSILNRILSISSIQVNLESLESKLWDSGFDLAITYQIEGRLQVLQVEVKETVTPKSARDICLQITSKISNRPENAYPVIAAPYISDSTIEVFKEYRVGCIDAQGNCLLSFGPLYVEVKGNPNINPTKRSIKALFSPKSSRVSRVMLSQTGKWWQVQEISKEANMSIGLVSDVKNRLLEEELIIEKDRKLKVNDPEKLLNLWVSNYTYKKNEIMEYYSLLSSEQIERKIAEACEKRNVRYALSLFSGALKLAPFVRMEKTFVFIEEDIESIAEQIGLKKVSTGANVVLLRPYDQGVLFQTIAQDGLQVVSPLQLYLDLKTYKGRGEEASSAIFQKFMENPWQQDQIMRDQK